MNCFTIHVPCLYLFLHITLDTTIMLVKMNIILLCTRHLTAKTLTSKRFQIKPAHLVALPIRPTTPHMTNNSKVYFRSSAIVNFVYITFQALGNPKDCDDAQGLSHSELSPGFSLVFAFPFCSTLTTACHVLNRVGSSAQPKQDFAHVEKSDKLRHLGNTDLVSARRFLFPGLDSRFGVRHGTARFLVAAGSEMRFRPTLVVFSGGAVAWAIFQ